jgi:hypothetical protein
MAMIRTSRVAGEQVTAEEFLRLIPDGQKADLIDGVIHMASPDSLDGQRSQCLPGGAAAAVCRGT